MVSDTDGKKLSDHREGELRCPGAIFPAVNRDVQIASHPKIEA